MMYCEKCCRIVGEVIRCPYCGSRRIRLPETKDPCFLTELDFISSGILEDVLRQNGIPFLKKGVLGAGIAVKVGPMLDRSRFYVSFDRLEEAGAVVYELFSEVQDISDEQEDDEQ